MDERLVAWARAVKARRRRARGPSLPVLWLFTDSRRLADPLATVARLPKGLAGVVLRHDRELDRVLLGCELARLCRHRNLRLVVAGDVRLARKLGAGVHLRAGRWPGLTRLRGRLVTSSAHSVADLRRCRDAGATLAFLSPAFPTASHPGLPALGPAKWGKAARSSGFFPVLALGGVNGGNSRRLPPRFCVGAGAIGALS